MEDFNAMHICEGCCSEQTYSLCKQDEIKEACCKCLQRVGNRKATCPLISGAEVTTVKSLGEFL
ncbi:hypothetical protein I79_024539 [Cricetulus griseus]|uniref:Uncharacterized protein n=1 Tax=Cricetulus griseus TaxID=10029 RepID=G3IKY4_CRIGR|nr:hypothetical protein I79_024539 [Cricetulus griseus]